MKKLHQTFIWKIYQTQTWNILHQNFILKKLTPYSEKIICKTKNFTPKNKTFTLNLIFFHKARKILNETLNKFLHKIRSTLHQTDGTFGIPYIFIYLMNYQQPLSRFNIVIRNGKIVWKHGPYCWYFRLNLKYLEWPSRAYIKQRKMVAFVRKCSVKMILRLF